MLPAVGQEMVELADWRVRDSREHISEIGEGLNFVALAGGDEGEQCRGGAAAVVGAGDP